MSEERRFPIQRHRAGNHIYEATTVPWWVAEIAYREYRRKWGNSQSMERLAERGGFGRDEFFDLLATAEEPA